TYEPSPTGPLARVVVAGEPLPMKLPAALPKPPLETIRDSEITGRRAVVLSTIGDPPENYAGGQWQEFTLMVDGKTFDPSRIDQRGLLGAGGEWTSRNPDLRDDHVFHIHTNPVQVTQVNGQPQADLQWRDTVVVPRQGGQCRPTFALPRLHRRLHDALPHDEPRGDGHDAGGRGLQGLTPRAWTCTPSPRPRRAATPRSPRDHPRNRANADSKAVTPISPAAQKFHLFILCRALDNSVTVSDSSAPGLMLGKRHIAD